MSAGLVLLTGASGYVGGRLRRALEAGERPLRCMARRPEHLRSRVAAGTEIVAGDVLDPSSLGLALRGVHTAYYLIHSMAASRDYAEKDRRGAEAFARAAREAGVRRIIYLGGLGQGDHLSRHLASRQEVGRILRESGVPTIEFRTSIVIGSGSLSFELVRALVEKLPAMVTPSWVEDADPADRDRGPRRLSDGRDRSAIGRERRLRDRRPGPGLLRRSHAEYAPSPPCAQRGIRDVLARALANEDLEFAATRWSDALSAQRSPRDWGGVTFGSRRVDSRAVWVDCAPTWHSSRSHGSAGTRAGTTATGSGASAASSTWP
ncbi:MAG TPA: NAD(P)H-binding protein [Gemmatimonadales bacterium]|nr:NAD(P)H-binding protein [Gemmatimonadales bacterium]